MKGSGEEHGKDERETGAEGHAAGAQTTRRQAEDQDGGGEPKKRFKVAPNEKRDRAPDEFADEDPKKTKINGLAVSDEEIDEDVDWAVDDNTGKELNPKEVGDARAEELD